MDAGLDSCADCREASYKCLDKNNYDKDKCADQFEAYKACKKQQLDERRREREARAKQNGGTFIW